jgi:fatty-acyl-CoA synthase
MAAGLLSLDYQFERNARVGVFAPNLVDYYVAQMACSMADLVLVNINPAYRAMELKYALNKVECEALLMVSNLKTSDYDEMLRTIAPEVDSCEAGQLNSEDLPYLKYVVKMDNKINNKASISMDELLDKASPETIARVHEVEQTIQPEDITNIQFTSGTTGAPKASTLTHFNVLNNGWLLSERLQYSENDRICCAVPLYHCFGMVLSNMAALCNGSEVMFPDEAFNPQASMKVISEK